MTDVQVGDLIRCSIRYTNQGEQCQTSIAYKSVVSAADRTGEAFGSDFWAHIKETWRNLQPDSSDLHTYSIFVTGLSRPEYSPYGEYSVPAGETRGLRSTASDLAPPFVAAGLRYPTGSRRIRDGQQRVSLLVEDDFQLQRLVSGIYDNVQALAAKMADPLYNQDAIATVIAVPVVVGIRYTGDPPTPYEISDPIQTWIVDEYVTSQVSRKHGRGK